MIFGYRSRNIYTYEINLVTIPRPTCLDATLSIARTISEKHNNIIFIDVNVQMYTTGKCSLSARIMSTEPLAIELPRIDERNVIFSEERLLIIQSHPTILCSALEIPRIEIHASRADDYLLPLATELGAQLMQSSEECKLVIHTSLSSIYEVLKKISEIAKYCRVKHVHIRYDNR